MTSTPPIITTRNSTTILSSHTTINAIVTPNRRKIHTLFRVILYRTIQLFRNSITIIRSNTNLVTCRARGNLTVLHASDTVLRPSIYNTTLPRHSRPRQTVVNVRPLLHLYLVRTTTQRSSVPRHTTPSPSHRRLINAKLMGFAILRTSVPTLRPIHPITRPSTTKHTKNRLTRRATLGASVLITTVRINNTTPPLIKLAIRNTTRGFRVTNRRRPRRVINLATIHYPRNRVFRPSIINTIVVKISRGLRHRAILSRIEMLGVTRRSDTISLSNRPTKRPRAKKRTMSHPHHRLREPANHTNLLRHNLRDLRIIHSPITLHPRLFQHGTNAHQADHATLNDKHYSHLDQSHDHHFTLLPATTRGRHHRRSGKRNFCFRIQVFSFSTKTSCTCRAVGHDQYATGETTTHGVQRQLFSTFRFDQISTRS